MQNVVHERLMYFGKLLVWIISDPVVILLMISIIFMYKRIAKKANKRHYRYQLEYTAVKDIIRGIFTGALISLLLEGLNVKILLTKQFFLLIPVAIILVLVNARWGCFSYVIPATYVVMKVLETFSVIAMPQPLIYKQLILLIGLLHIAEGVMVWLWGAENPYEERVQYGQILIRARRLTKYWPIPLVFFMHESAQPIFLYAILGYGDWAFKGQEKNKTRLAGKVILGYGVMVTFLGYGMLKDKIPLVGVLFILPWCHEAIFKVTQILEANNQMKKQ